VLHLEFARRAHRLSQRELGQKTHITQSFISFMEIGRLLPTPAQADRLSRVLGVPVDLLLKPVTPADVRDVADSNNVPATVVAVEHA
jgi:transcriptional regulator with XRE-family HTH domain